MQDLFGYDGLFNNIINKITLNGKKIIKLYLLADIQFFLKR